MSESRIKYFDIPVTVGMQGGYRQFVMHIQMRVLEHLFAIDDEGNTLERSQRDVNPSRVARMSKYLDGNISAKKPYIIPTLTGNIEGDVDFRPFEGSQVAGILRLKRGASLKFFDGQHRAVTITQVVNSMGRFKDTVSLLLTDNVPLQVRQQFFSDINSTATKVSAAQNKAYDRRDARNQLALHVAEKVYGIGGYLDYENNVVTGSNTCTFSFKALYDCLCRMFRLTAKTSSIVELQDDAARIMESWCKIMKWHHIAIGCGAPRYRQQNVGLHAVMINAIGLATCHMLERYTPQQVSEIIENSTIDAYESFAYAQWEGRCVDPVSWKIITDIRAVKLSASKLLQLLELVLPEEFRALETQYFDIPAEMFRTEDGGLAWQFEQDKETPWSVEEWTNQLCRIYASADIISPDPGNDFHVMAMELARAEQDRPLPWSHDETLTRLTRALQADRSECVFRLGMLKSAFIRSGFRMPGVVKGHEE